MCRFQNIDSAMLEWFRMARSKNIPVSDPMLQAKAVAVAEQMQLENFKASNGWLEKFKTRYKIKGMTVSGESGEVREETVESWKERLPQILAGYSPEDILNLDETGKFIARISFRGSKAVQRWQTVQGESNMCLLCKCRRR